MPGHRVLQLTTFIGCFACLFAGSVGLAVHGFAVSDDPASIYRVAAWLTLWTWIPSFVGFATVFPLIFPTGRLLSPRWRPVAAAAIGLVVTMSLLSAFTNIQPEATSRPTPWPSTPSTRRSPSWRPPSSR